MAKTYRAKVLKIQDGKVWLEMDLGFHVWKTVPVKGLQNVAYKLKPRQEIEVSVSMDKVYDHSRHAPFYIYHAKVIKWEIEEHTKKKS